MTLDKPQRQELEKVITKMRNRIEDDIEYQVKEVYGLEDKDKAPAGLEDDQREIREHLIEAIERETVDGHSWEKALELYITGTGYTIVNRLTALRCMEVRGLDVPNYEHGDRAVTQVRDDGRTPAADPLIENFEVASREEGIIEAYRRACRGMQDEIEILFDLESPYSVLDPDFGAFEELLTMLDEVDADIWAADDVLGWVYEYYNAEQLEAMNVNDLDTTDEVSVANQFYTPHWVVRMLTDNSLGKLYLEKTGQLEETLEDQERFSPDKRKNRENDPESAPTLVELCTYLVPGEAGDPTKLEDPSEIRVIDPACGSGHFLLYAFDILERIWWDMRPGVNKENVPGKILKHNLFGVDLDMRACQLASFNLYLKARSRAQAEGLDTFNMPRIGIVCADSRIADMENTQDVFDEVAGSRPHVREALDTILEGFQDVHGLGSLLDVKGTLEELFAPGQRSLLDDWSSDHTLQSFLRSLEDEISKRQDGESFLAQDLQSFLRLLLVLSQDYDVSLMNPPYGGSNRMPTIVTKYVKENYSYTHDYYTAFVELGDRLSKPEGRTAALIPRTFINKNRFQDFRKGLIGSRQSFDFLAEFGLGVLDNATVRTAGVILRDTSANDTVGTFIRLYDLSTENKEEGFIEELSHRREKHQKTRLFQRGLSKFETVPGFPLSFWAPDELRSLFNSLPPLDPNAFRSEGDPICRVVKGSATGDNRRFFRNHWEIKNYSQPYFPLAQGGSEAWIAPLVTQSVYWKKNGYEVQMQKGASLKNLEFLGREGLTWTHIKEGGQRFGYFPPGGMFDQSGNMVFPLEDMSIWGLLGLLNSELYHGLMLVLTPDRHWNVGDVGRLPGPEHLVNEPRIIDISKEMYQTAIQLQAYDIRSPFFIHSALMPDEDNEEYYFSSHPFAQEVSVPSRIHRPGKHDTFQDVYLEWDKTRKEAEEQIKKQARTIDNLVYDILGISEESVSAIKEEIPMRSSTTDNELTTTSSLKQEVKNLLLEISLNVISEDNDGILFLWNEGAEEEPALFSRIEEKFEEIFGEHAHDRLAEADSLLETQSTGEGTYPNLQAWLKDKLFDFHISKFENTPILWKITTEDLVADPIDEGFNCLVDYHQLDTNTFQRIMSRYLEVRENVLRDKQNAANQRRSDSSLSAEDRATATEEYERCRDALRQIEEFKLVIKRLSRPEPRDWDEQDRQLAANLAPQVDEFRKRMETRLNTLDKLVEITDISWFEDHFSPTFLERVQENRDEWIEALEDLQQACKAYSKEPSEPVEAHHYDLFDYFEELIGTTHYGSNGIFFTNYYFSKDEAKNLLDEKGRPKDGLAEREQLLAELAAETDQDVELGEEIKEACQTLSKAIPSDWETRALEEITCAGYRPNKKHGVRINIKPLAEAGIVPDIVEEKVL